MSSERISILIENNLTDWKLEICEGRESQTAISEFCSGMGYRSGRAGGKMINPSLAQLCCVNFSFSKLSHHSPSSLTLVFVTILKIFQGEHLVGKTKLSWLGFLGYFILWKILMKRWSFELVHHFTGIFFYHNIKYLYQEKYLFPGIEIKLVCCYCFLRGFVV